MLANKLILFHIVIFFDDDRVIIEPTKICRTVSVSPYNTDLFQIIKKIALKKYPGSASIPILVPYATDSRYFRSKDFICYGFTPTVIDMDEMLLMHSDNEKISLEQFKNGIELMYEIVSEFCAIK